MIPARHCVDNSRSTAGMVGKSDERLLHLSHDDYLVVTTGDTVGAVAKKYPLPTFWDIVGTQQDSNMSGSPINGR